MTASSKGVSGTIHRVLDSIRSHKSFLIVGHEGPDGDSLSSQLTLYLMLKKLGKDVKIWSKDPLPDTYTFLPGCDCIEVIGNRVPKEVFDVVFVLDIGEPSRIGFAIPSFNSDVINIDHHPGVPEFGTINFLDESASATAEIIYDIVLAIGCEIDEDMAINLYTGIITDTGSFQFKNTSKRTFEMAARLVDCGVKPSVISEKVFYSISEKRLKLLSLCLNRLEVHKEERIAVATITLDDYVGAGVHSGYNEDFVNFPRSVKGVDVAVLLKELEPGFFKASLRSKGNVDISVVARFFGGGGHKAAASCKVRGSLEEVKSLVFPHLKEAVKKAEQ